MTDRTELERKLSKEIAKEFGVEMKKIIDLLGNPPRIENVPESFWNENGERLREMIEPLMLDAYMTGSEAEVEKAGIGIDWGLVNGRAVSFAQNYLYDQIKDINATSRNTVRQAISDYYDKDMTREMLEARLRGTFGVVRSEMIAITEVTRATVEGEYASQQEILSANPYLKCTETWITSVDERVCIVCGGRHGKKKGDGWIKPPPAHPRCRCDIKFYYEVIP